MKKLDLKYEGGGSWFQESGDAPDPAFCLAFMTPQERDEAQRWREEALALREGMAKLAEAFGWRDVRQENGDLHLPCAEDIIERAKQVNVNDQVWVQLTRAGLKHYAAEPVRQHIRAFMPKYAEPVQDVMKFSLWELMCIFGPGMRIGAEPLFEKQLLHFQEPQPQTAQLQLLKDEGSDDNDDT